MESVIDEIEREVGMTDGELESFVKNNIDDAVNYTDTYLSREREESTKYYRGDPFGDEEEGRSKIVMTTLRDSVQQALPSLMRVFAGSERMVEFVPRGPRDVKLAELATQYVNYVLMQDNDGYRLLWSAFKDALHKKCGIIKVSWDDSLEVSTHYMTDLTEMGLVALSEEEGVEIVVTGERLDPQFGPMYDVEVRRRRPKDRILVETLPPEEFLVDRDARSLDESLFVGHRSLRTPSELVAMGYDEDLVQSKVTKTNAISWNRERHERNRWENTDAGGARDRDRVLYTECYVYVDFDGDGIAELRRICCMGDDHEVVDNRPWDIRPFADFHVDPEPHTFFGHDLADRTKDLQRINSQIMRHSLDALAQTVHPRVAAVESQVNLEDLMNNENGAIVRMQAPGMVQPLAQPFPRESLEMLAQFQLVKEQRTGLNRQSSGIDADSLQSMTASAVNAIEQGSKQMLEVMARNLAETGMKRLMKLILRLVVQNQDRGRMVRLSGEWQEIDPAVWDANMDVAVNVALGAGLEARKQMALERTLEAQIQALTQMGPSNPLVGLGNLRHTLGKLLEMGGIKDTNSYFKPLPVDFELPPQPDEPSAEELYYQAEREKVMADIQMSERKLQLEAQKIALDDDRERDKHAADFTLKAAEIGVKMEDVDLKRAREKLNAADS